MILIFTSSFIFLFGLAIGSFLNVLVDRLSKEENPLAGRSRCDYCRKILSLFDLIPVVSFILLQGRCRYCHKKLSWQYPIIEIASGLMFLSLFYFLYSSYSFPPTEILYNLILKYFSLTIIFSSLLVIFVADLKYQIIPDQMVISSLLGTIVYVVTFNELVQQNFLAGMGATAFFLSIYLVTRGRGMGFGDVKLSFPLGLWLGFPKIVIGLYVAFLTGALVSIILILAKKKRLKERIAFGPFMIWGAVISFFLGNQISQWYLSFFR